MAGNRKQNPKAINPISDAASRRATRENEQKSQRKERRSDLFQKNRGIAASQANPQKKSIQVGNDASKKKVPKPTEKLMNRQNVLDDWRSRKKSTRSKTEQKPPFRAGVVRHKLSSPKFLHSEVTPKHRGDVLRKRIQLKKITRCTRGPRTSGNLSAIFSNLQNSRQSNLRSSNSTRTTMTDWSVTENCQIANDNRPTNLTSLPLEELSVENNLSNEAVSDERTVSDSDTDSTAGKMQPKFIYSPFVVSSRGKENVRLEQKQRLVALSSTFDEIPTKDTVMENLNISIKDEERTAQYFEHILNNEIERLEELCATWLEHISDTTIPEDARFLIHQTIGQTKLLMNKKLERFRGLVHDCETGEGKMLVSCRDLQGFWDNVHLDIDNCNDRFGKLVELKNNNWVEKEVHPSTKPVLRKTRIRDAKKNKVPQKASSIRATIRALYEKKKNGAGLKEGELLSQGDTIAFAVVSSPKKPASNNPLTQSSASKRATRLSEGRKVEMNSTLRAIRVSNLFKPVTVELDSSISYVNSTQTPGKSILKKTDGDSTMNSTKSQNKVNFDHELQFAEVPDPADPFEANQEETPANISCCFDEYSFDEDLKSNVKKALTFVEDSENDSGDDTLKALDEDQLLPSRNDSPAGGDISNVVSTRSRTVSSSTEDTLTPFSPTDSVEVSETSIQTDPASPGSEAKPIRSGKKTPGIRKRSRVEILCQEDGTNKLISSTPVAKKKGRSTPKSTKFEEETCLKPLPSKPVAPVTPHPKRTAHQKQKEILSEVESNSSGSHTNLSSPPQDPPVRARRSMRLASKYTG